MQNAEIDYIIRNENETMTVDYKKSQYENKESLLKDIMSMANANTDINKRYIIVGVKHTPNGNKEFYSIPENEFKDDAEYQQLIRNNIEPEINFKYYSHIYEGHLLGVFEISECNKRPYMIMKDNQTLKKGTCLIRRGSQQAQATRGDFEIIYDEKHKMQRERDVKFLYLHLLRYEFINNKKLLWEMSTYIKDGPLINELWTPAGETSRHFIFEAWDSLLQSGQIASLEQENVETFRYAIKTLRDAIYHVRISEANWLRVLNWNQAQDGDILRMIFPNRELLQQNISKCTEAIKIAENAIQQSIELLEKSYNMG